MSVSLALIIGLQAAPAYAYLDPGTGSLIIQSVIGAAAAVGITLKLYWHKIKLMFSGRKPQDDQADKAKESAEKKEQSTA